MKLCEYCGREINPIALPSSRFKNHVKYHDGCRLKANAQKARERRERGETHKS